MADIPTNFMRAFALNGERGVLFASFPAEPGEVIPLTGVFRAHEVWSGCEYQVACHLIQEGLVAEGEAIVQAIRARHDGSTRNPWNEPECGDHYARALASYGLLQAYSLLQIDLGAGRLALAPQGNWTDFVTFFAVEGAWGTVRLDPQQLTIELGGGALTLQQVLVAGQVVPLEGSVTITSGQPSPSFVR